jgi:hypothetical protein
MLVAFASACAAGYAAGFTAAISSAFASLTTPGEIAAKSNFCSMQPSFRGVLADLKYPGYIIQRIYVRLIQPSFGLKTGIDSDAVNPGISGAVTTKAAKTVCR